MVLHADLYAARTRPSNANGQGRRGPRPGMPISKNHVFKVRGLDSSIKRTIPKVRNKNIHDIRIPTRTPNVESGSVIPDHANWASTTDPLICTRSYVT